jgi:hypothetical protein
MSMSGNIRGIITGFVLTTQLAKISSPPPHPKQ